MKIVKLIFLCSVMTVSGIFGLIYFFGWADDIMLEFVLKPIGALLIVLSYAINEKIHNITTKH